MGWRNYIIISYSWSFISISTSSAWVPLLIHFYRYGLLSLYYNLGLILIFFLHLVHHLQIYWKDFLNCQGIGNVLTAKARASNGHMSVTDTSQNETLDAGPGNLKMSFSSTSGQLKRMTNYRTGVKDLDVELESTKQKSKQNLQQAILIERERVT
ncbi:uncharacterized protein LOC131251420 isoform X1 [Magnolia sinica]|uniref:uncharacterized protein LOC131251420 isoform X1 n=1 Tax=Magnolia sinica TaxID=86752 RepID=UPI00265920D4|nr:uncharacterized protein LOC131251420 isoform X1 [Magnolia sinica]